MALTISTPAQFERATVLPVTELWSTPVFELFDTTFSVTSSDPGIVATARAVFRDLSTVEGMNASDAAVPMTAQQTGIERFELFGPTVWAGLVSETEVMARIMTAVNRLALDTTVDKLCLHGAAASIRGAGIAMLARSGTGKTTILAALMQTGASGLTDEMLVVNNATGTVSSWPKPLSIKPGSVELIPELEHLLLDFGHQFRHVPISALGKRADDPLALSRIYILDRAGAMQQSSMDLDPLDAAVAIIDNSLNFVNVGLERSMSAVGQLVANASCMRLALGPPGDTAEAIVSDNQRSPPLITWEVSTAKSRRVTNGVVTLRLGSESVVAEPVEGNYLALDVPGTEQWLRIADGDESAVRQFPDFSRLLLRSGLLN